MLLKDRFAMLNLIPYNAVDGLAFARPSVERAEAIAQELNARGILTRLRQSAGQDVDAGCGQLRARAAAPMDGRRRIPLQPERASAA